MSEAKTVENEASCAMAASESDAFPSSSNVAASGVKEISSLSSGKLVESGSMSSSSSLATSRDPSADDLSRLASTNSKAPIKKTLDERRRIPLSAYVSWGLVLSLQYFSGMWHISTLESWMASMTKSSKTVHNLLLYFRDLTRSFFAGELQSWKEFGQALVVMAVVGSMLHVFFIAPFRAGLWTGPRSRRALVHRYMGLFFLVQYALAWVEFLTDYESAKSSFLPHTIALNGTDRMCI